MTPIQLIETDVNNLFVKREDLIPFSFGGNKVRKAKLFFNDIDNGGYDCVVTYGSGSSNHCRVVANMCASRGIPCVIVSPQETSEETFNRQMMKLFGAKINVVPLNCVHDTIEKTIQSLKKEGHKPYFIQGGGHGNIGTKAYVECFNEIIDWEKNSNIKFDYIFLASGTGTTQAGLICGKILNKTNHDIIGISIARKNPNGKNIVLQSAVDFLGEDRKKDIELATTFVDDYVGEGYGKNNSDINKTIKNVLLKYGIPLDSTYTGKSFYGMQEYIKKNNLANKNILFIHTGGTPLFFDFLKK